MTTTDPYAGFSTKKTPQNQQVPGRTEQVKNNAGGYVFQITPMAQLRRFLTIGSAGGTYYVGQNELTEENGKMVISLTENAETHIEMVDTIVEISVAGRALKQQPCLFALAIACQMGTLEGKQHARKQITQVVRTGSHLFTFVKYLNQFGGWSMGLRKAVAKWYVEKPADQLAYQLVKYRSRDGYTHRDVLRLTHPRIEDPFSEDSTLKQRIDLVEASVVRGQDTSESLRQLIAERDELVSKRASLNWAVRGEINMEALPRVVTAFEAARDQGNDVAEILETNNLPWEALPDSAMNDAKVWDKMLDNGVPLTALIRQLPRLTNLGLLPQMGQGRTQDVIDALINEDALVKARIHPIQILVALRTYQLGSGVRSQWTPTAKIVDALDEAYYRSFGAVPVTGLRTLECLDVSGSMATYQAGNLPLTCREASAALAMVTARVEKNYQFLGFASGYNGWRAEAALTTLNISPRQRLDDVVRSISNLPFGGTDCSLPMLHAAKHGLEVDLFKIYTDNETWAGSIHPYQALRDYRQKSGIDAKLVVLSMTPSKFSIADPRDPGMLDISGMDSAVPTLISEFALGNV